MFTDPELQPRSVTLLGCALLPLALLSALAVRLKWLVPFAIFILTWKCSGFLVSAIVLTIIGTAIYEVILIEELVELWHYLAIAYYHPIRWTRQRLPQSSLTRALTGPGWGSLFVAYSRSLYLLGLFSGIYIVRWHLALHLFWEFVAVFALMSLLRCVFLLSAFWPRQNRIKVVLLRRFNVSVSDFVSEGLVPVLGAYANVVTAFDETLERAEKPLNVEDVPIPTIEVRHCGEDWKTDLCDLIRSTDVVVVDITSPSPTMAWELSKAAEFQKPIVLVGSIYTLYDTRKTLMNDLCELLTMECGEAVACNIIRRCGPPIPYGKGVVLGSIFSIAIWSNLISIARDSDHAEIR